MKSMDEFRADVYARAEKEIKKRRSRAALLRRYGSLAAMLVVVLASVFAVTRLVPRVDSPDAETGGRIIDASETTVGINQHNETDAETTAVKTAGTKGSDSAVITTAPKTETTYAAVTTYFATTTTSAWMTEQPAESQTQSAVFDYELGECKSPDEMQSGAAIIRSRAELDSWLAGYFTGSVGFADIYGDDFFGRYSLAVFAIKTDGNVIGVDIRNGDVIEIKYGMRESDGTDDLFITLIPCSPDTFGAILTKTDD